jgi:chromosome segregation ATPase
MNNLLKFRSVGSAIGGAISAIAGHHYGSKILSYKEDKQEEQMQTQRDEVLFQMKEKLEKVENQLCDVKEQLSKHNNILETKDDTVMEQFKDELEGIVENMNSGRKSLDEGRENINSSFSNTIDD